VVDAAHNAECAAAIEPLLARLGRETGRAPLVVAGALGAERARPLLAVLARHARALLLVRVGQERACGFEELEACVPPEFYGEVLRSDVAEIFPAPGECALGGEGEAIVVAGSVYLAGEVLARFLPDSVGEPFLQDALTPPRV
jgi:dihydrofolate synthase/folylpolyglutamate synthase